MLLEPLYPMDAPVKISHEWHVETQGDATEKNSTQQESSDASFAGVSYRVHCPLTPVDMTAHTSPKSVYVGTLGAKFQFPSDHLPVGAAFVESHHYRPLVHKIASFNVLNDLFMDWVKEKNSQGLNGSLITQLDVPVPGKPGLTERDLYVIEILQNMMQHQHLIALQECGTPFLHELESSLPAGWAMVKMGGDERSDQEVLLYKTNRFDLVDVEIVYPYASFPKRALPDITLRSKKTGRNLHVINTHIPGDPNLPGREEFAEYVTMQTKRFPNEIMVALGDHNFDRQEMIAAYRKAGLEVGKDYTFWSPWNTNIDPYSRKTKVIDHVFIKGAKTSRALAPNEIMSPQYGLNEVVDLLSTPNPG